MLAWPGALCFTKEAAVSDGARFMLTGRLELLRDR